MCDHPEASVDDYLDELWAKVLKDGWAAVYVEDDRMPFAYTIGLHDCGLPELLVTGVSPQRALRMLNTAVANVPREGAPPPGRQVRMQNGPLVEVVEIEHPDVHLTASVAINGPVRAVQLVWADGKDRWPWFAGFCDGRTNQPVFGVRAGSDDLGAA
jgi:hypothetical protein